MIKTQINRRLFLTFFPSYSFLYSCISLNFTLIIPLKHLSSSSSSSSSSSYHTLTRVQHTHTLRLPAQFPSARCQSTVTKEILLENSLGSDATNDHRLSVSGLSFSAGLHLPDSAQHGKFT
ncbi:hypothetical protein E2C01_008357 [Portunus trituberculatus]|uniref:Uncharacterized protein n=1 Tax=Portunus trituberculatus TaxID=210409 RepID=A0A5B7D2W9_PORTR|nr:hypothetical protein [Portunus trituberculatus]